MIEWYAKEEVKFRDFKVVLDFGEVVLESEVGLNPLEICHFLNCYFSIILFRIFLNKKKLILNDNLQCRFYRKNSYQ